MFWSIAPPLIALALLAGLIYYLGGASFGRSQTQNWIDATGKYPRLNGLLNRFHGNIRASAHYIEFGGLFLVLYWIWDAIWGSGLYAFRPMPALIIGLVCVIAAILDELHQIQSGTRQFRRVDVLHSTCGISIAAFLVLVQTMLRGIE